MKKVVLAYSGGLDTSVAIKWLAEKYQAEVIAVALDVGQQKDLSEVKNKAYRIGAKKVYLIDAKKEFAEEFIFPTLFANGLYEGRYAMSASLSRPLIAKKLVEIAEKEGAEYVAHGATGKGNDQVRFEVSIAALNPSLKVIAPVREWGLTRDEEIEYAKKNDIPIPVDIDSPYSIDENLWGRSIECGVLEDPWNAPPEEPYTWTKKIEDTPDEPTVLEIYFEKGVPKKINGKEMGSVELITYLNKVGGENGIGRIDMIENRLVGIKSRETYETPAALILIEAHRDLESLVSTREVFHFKAITDQKYAELVYNGLWYSPLKNALDSFNKTVQENVTGTIRMKLFKGNIIIDGRKSPYSLYDFNLATYDEKDMFDHKAAKGFIDIFGLPIKVYSEVQRSNK